MIEDLSIEDILCITSVVGCLLFSLIKKEHILFILSLQVLTLAQFKQGRLQHNMNILPTIEVKDEKLKFLYDKAIYFEKELFHDVSQVLSF